MNATCDHLIIGGGTAGCLLARRLAAASVFPALVTVNICNTVMMVAEKAADMIAAGA